MEKLPNDAILLGAITFFEKEPENVETTIFVSRLKQHLAINLESLYSDKDVTYDELKDCISQLKQLLATFETYADSNNSEGISNLLKELGVSNVKDEEGEG